MKHPYLRATLLYKATIAGSPVRFIAPPTTPSTESISDQSWAMDPWVCVDDLFIACHIPHKLPVATLLADRPSPPNYPPLHLSVGDALGTFIAHDVGPVLAAIEKGYVPPATREEYLAAILEAHVHWRAGGMVGATPERANMLQGATDLASIEARSQSRAPWPWI